MEREEKEEGRKQDSKDSKEEVKREIVSGKQRNMGYRYRQTKMNT